MNQEDQRIYVRTIVWSFSIQLKTLHIGMKTQSDFADVTTCNADKPDNIYILIINLSDVEGGIG